MKKITVEYYAGTYKGTRTVYADSEEDAIDMVRRFILLSLFNNSSKHTE